MDGNVRFGRDFCVGNERGGVAGKGADRLISLSNTSIMKLLFIREVRIGCDRVGMVRMVGGQDER